LDRSYRCLNHIDLVPAPRIFAVLVERYGIDPARAVFIDDVATNTAAAEAFGMHTIHFASPAQRAAELEAVGLR